jgi:two-component system, NarL family, nitrate/nitrite response regulator NarL
MSRTIRIGVIDDHPLLLDGILHALRSNPEYEIVGTGETKAEAIAMAQTLRPEIMLLDVGIAGGGIEGARHISKANPDVKLIMFTASDRPDHVNAALAAGVMGYVLKGASSRELCESIRVVCGGKRYITPELALMLLTPHPNGIAPVNGENTPPKLSKKDFTSREIDVIQLLSAGKTNKVIANELALSEKTVKHHMSNIMEKLQVHNRLSAALILSKWDLQLPTD